ncbi:hypothetical protein C8E98_1579 [Corynebacterium pseudotuberculosis]|nr:hypothetical protein C8E98_1579 [Corynebacterium pseudotuberculosis]
MATAIGYIIVIVECEFAGSGRKLGNYSVNVGPEAFDTGEMGALVVLSP